MGGSSAATREENEERGGEERERQGDREGDRGVESQRLVGVGDGGAVSVCGRNEV